VRGGELAGRMWTLFPLPALSANAIDLKLVIEHLESELFGGGVLHGFNFRVEELD
jgi:hypothetical protein